eukprot:9964454-Lingulodinium_polyedra.AAC.2
MNYNLKSYPEAKKNKSLYSEMNYKFKLLRRSSLTAAAKEEPHSCCKGGASQLPAKEEPHSF